MDAKDQPSALQPSTPVVPGLANGIVPAPSAPADMEHDDAARKERIEEYTKTLESIRSRMLVIDGQLLLILFAQFTLFATAGSLFLIFVTHLGAHYPSHLPWYTLLTVVIALPSLVIGVACLVIGVANTLIDAGAALLLKIKGQPPTPTLYLDSGTPEWSASRDAFKDAYARLTAAEKEGILLDRLYDQGKLEHAKQKERHALMRWVYIEVGGSSFGSLAAIALAFLGR